MVNIGINVDSNNKVINVFLDPVNGAIRLDISDEILNDLKACKSYKYENNQLIADPDGDTLIANQNRIEELKQQLKDTDWISVKISEYEHLGKTLDHDYSTELTQRQAWRDEINQLSG